MTAVSTGIRRLMRGGFALPFVLFALPLMNVSTCGRTNPVPPLRVTGYRAITGFDIPAGRLLYDDRTPAPAFHVPPNGWLALALVAAAAGLWVSRHIGLRAAAWATLCSLTVLEALQLSSRVKVPDPRHEFSSIDCVSDACYVLILDILLVPVAGLVLMAMLWVSGRRSKVPRRGWWWRRRG